MTTPMKNEVLNVLHLAEYQTGSVVSRQVMKSEIRERDFLCL